ncbi:hypothetical protein [Parahaliea mediterranea]|uniref:hypothetical protein n=1 Tax=Parahaliea mediterranea TaxID=651086 RepID=UPI000E2E74D7|nr:hypothetical protein [Parahaliea mediterranea]
MINRRQFVIGGAAAGGAAAITYTLVPGDSADTVPAPAPEATALRIDTGISPAMDEFLLSLEHTDTLGRAWLAGDGSGIGLAQLASTVAQRIDGSAADIAAATATRIQQDFAQGTLCDIEGWQLSLTECQLAALRVLAIEANPANRAVLAANEATPEAAANSPDGYTVGTIAPLQNWGPKKTAKGLAFNVQSDGHCGLWFQIAGAPAHAKIMIDGEIARTTIKGKVVTSGLFGKQKDHILSTPGTYEIALIDPIRKVKQPIGEFLVEESPAGQLPGGESIQLSDCTVGKWGPQKTQVGVALNEQPDGAMGVWVYISCLPHGARLRIGEDDLPITRTKFGFTTAIPKPLLEAPQNMPLHLVTPGDGQELAIGNLLIEEPE